jgi:hypothetical protein
VWLFLLVFTLLLYPTLLLGSSYLGSSVGMMRDINASRALARALNYAADPRFPVEPGNDGQLATSALDSNLVALQLNDGRAPAGSAQAGAPGTGSADSSSATPAGATPASGGGGGTAGVTPSPNPVAPPLPGPTAPPVSPPPSPTPSPSASPTTCSSLPPVGSGTFDGKVRDSQDQKVVGALVTVYWNGCLVGSATTGVNGRFAIPGLAPNRSYTYTFAALGHPQGSGSFATGPSGNYSRDPQFQ